MNADVYVPDTCQCLSAQPPVGVSVHVAHARLSNLLSELMTPTLGAFNMLRDIG